MQNETQRLEGKMKSQASAGQVRRAGKMGTSLLVTEGF